MGTPDFAVPSLAALREAGHEILAVYTQPPRPSGRGHAVHLSPVAAYAEAAGLPVRCPPSLRDAAAQEAFAALGLDAAVVAAYGLILPPPILAAPRLGCINVHASLLPRWRGAAPIQRAILAGDAETGITIMQMEKGLDTGPILAAETVPIGPDETAAELHDRLAAVGARLLVRTLADLAGGHLVPRSQPGEGVTYAAKLGRDEGRLDWRRPAEELIRAVRALEPWPGTWFCHAGERIRVRRAERLAAPPGAPPGRVLDDRLAIACGGGAFRPLVLQRPGRAPGAAEAVLRGFAIPAGTRLECPATN